jgi:hypothetical protein
LISEDGKIAGDANFATKLKNHTRTSSSSAGTPYRFETPLENGLASPIFIHKIGILFKPSRVGGAR